MAKSRVVVVVSDIHGVKVSRPAFDTALNAIERIRPHEVWNLGDHVDLASLTHHEKSPDDQGLTLSKELRQARELLAELQAVSPRGCGFRFFQGNHEYRYDRYFASGACPGVLKDSFPRSLRQRKGLALDALGWEYIDREAQEPYWVGDLAIFHGQWYSRHHAAKHADELGAHCIYGHTHRPQQFIRRTARGVIVATGVPCLRILDREWEHMKKAPFSGWANGFAVVEFDGDTPHVSNVVVDAGRAAWGGMLFAA